MAKFFHKAVAGLLLVACIFSGVNVSCAWLGDTQGEHACGGSHDGHAHDHESSEPASSEHTNCPCVGCHIGCAHTAFLISSTTIPAVRHFSAGIMMHEPEPRLLTRSAEIFIPPKLAA